MPAPPREGQAQVSGRIEVAPALSSQVPPGAALFVYAYAVDGPRVPLALRRYAVSDLPLAFTLDDSAAVNPAFRLSMAAQVVVGARLGASAPMAAAAAPGELIGSSAPVAVGARDVHIVIDKRAPGGAKPQ